MPAMAKATLPARYLPTFHAGVALFDAAEYAMGYACVECRQPADAFWAILSGTVWAAAGASVAEKRQAVVLHGEPVCRACEGRRMVLFQSGEPARVM